MIDENMVFQRTDSGREEIRRKTHGLTQSERLVLIFVDGVADVGVIRNKLKGVSDVRFTRALNKLVSHHFVQEVLLPMAGQAAETVDDRLAALFLRQDALDPVTIISLDPEDEFDSATAIPSQGPGASTAGSSTVAVDLHLWQSGQAVQKDPFPIIRTESRITPPVDLRMPHDPISERVRRLTPIATARPAFDKPAEAAEVRPPVDLSTVQGGGRNAAGKPKDVSMWLFWVLLTLVSMLTAAYILLS